MEVFSFYRESSRSFWPPHWPLWTKWYRIVTIWLWLSKQRGRYPQKIKEIWSSAGEKRKWTLPFSAFTLEKMLMFRWTISSIWGKSKASEQSLTPFHSFFLSCCCHIVCADHEPAVEILHSFQQIDNFFGRFFCFPHLREQQLLMIFVELFSFPSGLLQKQQNTSQNSSASN